MAEHSVDIVSKIHLQELRNALQQAQKELSVRFDFRGSSASLAFEEAAGLINVTADDRAQLRGVIDILEQKLAKRGVSLKALAWKEPDTLPSGSMKQQASLQQGLSSDKAKEIVKHIQALGLKAQARINGETVRVSSKQIDTLQAVIAALKTTDVGVPIQAENYR